ncbi:hypothetical protein PYW07_010638 [Mythimna separata]|uniref:Uncharacterized protein n=1 Tax=Mythimna separata TaxID=271217 RepID=A0AAD7YAH8_MYTSE|nr:hypothetical protein PYW07_010638 [Mythimna separata]
MVACCPEFDSSLKLVLFELLKIKPKMTRIHFKLLFLTFYFIQSHAMMIRNDALISKMVNDFQKDNSMASQQQQQELRPQQEQKLQQRQTKNVLALMQNVLCKNFPTVPCNMIVQDETLKNLIQRSIQQLKYKKMSLEKTTQMPTQYHLTLFPTFNSEDLSNYLQVDSSYHKNKVSKRKKTAPTNLEVEEHVEPKKRMKMKKETRTVYSGRKKIRKFYPHKMKYKDKMKGRQDFGDYSEEKLSMSVEVPDMNMGGTLEISRGKGGRMNYKADTDDGTDPPVWRIDYMKHGESGLNVFGNEPDRLKEKLVKTGRPVLVSENMLEPGVRKDVLHPDVYIKKNYIRKNALLELNSGSLD